MEQKFVTFDDAVEKLGVTSEQLTRLRESGDLRAYRDGPSWKFRSDEIQKMMDEGVPEPAPPSDIGLALPEELVDAEPLKDPVADDDDDLKLADDDATSSTEASGVDLVMADDDDDEVDPAELDDTVTAGASDVSLDLEDDGSDPSDSILLSEEELGESLSTPPSTIIGKSELAKDADLELSLPGDSGAGSDTKLAGGASDVLSSGTTNADVLSDKEEKDDDSGGSSAFDNLDELEIDLAAESGSVVGSGSQATAKAPDDSAKEGESDLDLDDEGTDPAPSDLGLAATSSVVSVGPTSDLDLATDAEDDDFVLAESGGSDITLDSASSGINLDPSDSGLALDDISLDVGGSAILSSLSLENEDEEQDISLVSDDDDAGADLQSDDGFDLTPMVAAEEDDDSSSQVIALDAEIEGLEDQGAEGILDEDAFAEADDDAVVLTDDYAAADADALGVSTYSSAARADSEYSVMNIVGLGCCVFMLLLGMVVMLDMARNIWSWNETYALNSWLLDGVLGLFGN